MLLVGGRGDLLFRGKALEKLRSESSRRLVCREICIYQAIQDVNLRFGLPGHGNQEFLGRRIRHPEYRVQLI